MRRSSFVEVGACWRKKSQPLVVLFWLNRFLFVFRCRWQTIFNCVFNQLDHRLHHTMDKKFKTVLDAMPSEYEGRFLQYNLLKRYISLQCSVKREFEDPCNRRELEAADVLCSLQCSVKRKIEKCSTQTLFLLWSTGTGRADAAGPSASDLRVWKVASWGTGEDQQFFQSFEPRVHWENEGE